MLFSDYGTPVSHHFSAYGCHTFRWANKEGKAVFVKVSSVSGSHLATTDLFRSQYHWRSEQGVKQFDYEETLQVQGEDPDYAKRDLYETIDKGGSLKWTLFVQVERTASIPKLDRVLTNLLLLSRSCNQRKRRTVNLTRSM